MENRLHALDAIRGMALLLGLVVHGSMAYWPNIAEQGFPIADPSSSHFLGLTVFVLHMFRMAVFFLIAGLFAHLALHRKGLTNFWKDRSKRIVVPLFAGTAIAYPLIAPAIMMAVNLQGGSEYLEVQRPVSALGGNRGGPLFLHFWFLYYLLWFYGGATACSLLAQGLDRHDRLLRWLDRGVAVALRSGLLPLLLILASALTFHQRAHWNPWVGVPTPLEDVWREIPALTVYGLAFVLGWQLDRQRDLLQTLARHWPAYLTLAILFSALSLRLAGLEPFDYSRFPAEHKALGALSYAAASWGWVLALVGLGMRYFNQENPTRRYIADASYWIYILHLPLLWLGQALMLEWPLHWSIKFILLLGICTPLLFWSYHRWIRYGPIGRWLNGPRSRTAVAAGVKMG